MRIYVHVNGQPVPMWISPTGVNWEPPPVKGFDGRGAPVYMPFWECRLAFARLTCVEYEDWRGLCDGQRHTLILPHPTNGSMTTFTNVYIVTVTPRLNTRDSCLAAASGVDVELTRVAVSGAP